MPGIIEFILSQVKVLYTYEWCRFLYAICLFYGIDVLKRSNMFKIPVSILVNKSSVAHLFGNSTNMFVYFRTFKHLKKLSTMVMYHQKFTSKCQCSVSTTVTYQHKKINFHQGKPTRMQSNFKF